MKPLPVSHLKRIGQGQHNFRKQAGRLPIGRSGTRAAADGMRPSFWEPGMAYRPDDNLKAER